jgi:fluoride exporter
MVHLFIVMIGGALGAGLRHLANLGAVRAFGVGFPFGTMLINIIGSLAMGLFMEILMRRFGSSNELRLFIATGILGGFTTFSAFSLDFVHLWQRGDTMPALGYAVGSVVLSVIALSVGLILGRTFG